MGYEYDFVFDWMVKKQNPQNPSATLRTEEEQKAEEAQNQIPQ